MAANLFYFPPFVPSNFATCFAERKTPFQDLENRMWKKFGQEEKQMRGSDIRERRVPCLSPDFANERRETGFLQDLVGCFPSEEIFLYERRRSVIIFFFFSLNSFPLRGRKFAIRIKIVTPLSRVEEQICFRFSVKRTSPRKSSASARASLIVLIVVYPFPRNFLRYSLQVPPCFQFELRRTRSVSYNLNVRTKN